MAKIDTEQVDVQRVRSMSKRLADYVSQVEKYADEMEKEGLKVIEAKNFASFDRALKDLSRTVSGLFLGYQTALNRRVSSIPIRGKTKRGTTAFPVCQMAVA